jgi:putative hydrolase of the HAD superfamily
MDVQAVIFDRDQTLVHLPPAQLGRLIERLRVIAPGLELASLRSAWEHWPGPWPRTEADEPIFWLAFATAVAQSATGHVDLQALADEFAALYHTSSVSYEDVAPTLKQLRAHGLRLAVLSNFELPSIAVPLRCAGIDPTQFELLSGAALLGHAKPDPATYLAVAASLGLPPEACWFIDDLTENVEGARLVGMRAFQIDRARPSDPVGGVIGSLLDLIGLLPATTAAPALPSHARAVYDRST